MAESSTFFASVDGDRVYTAAQMAQHFSDVLTSGVFPDGDQLAVTESAGMAVSVSAGNAWINGYSYHNSSSFTLTHDAADGVLNRIDRIVVRWGRVERAINLAIIKGTAAASPSAPAVVRSADYYDLGIATVSIAAGITAITQAMITDTRAVTAVCGNVSSLITPGDLLDRVIALEGDMTTAQEDIVTAQGTADDALPLAGGALTGDVTAYSTNRNTYSLRNAIVQDSGGSAVSTDRLIFKRV